MAISGLGLVGFVVVHLLGNLTLLSPNPQVFNAYAHSLEKWGPLLTVAEVGLFLIFALHIFTAIQVTLRSKAARPVAYQAQQSKRGPSKSTVGSRNMIVSGLILFGFLILHLWQFRLGPGKAEGYVASIANEEVRDLHRLVSEAFHQPFYAGLYVAVMIFLGVHLRHGFWSAFQSLGLAFPKYTKCIYGLGLLVALALAGGFLLIPAWMYFDLGAVLGVAK